MERFWQIKHRNRSINLLISPCMFDAKETKTKEIVLVENMDSCSQVTNDEVILRENGTLHLSLKVSYIATSSFCFLFSFSALK